MNGRVGRLTASMLIATCAFGYSAYRGEQRKPAITQEEHAAELFASFKDRCPPEPKNPSCFYDPQTLGEAARIYVTLNKAAPAGLAYAMIGKPDVAGKIAGLCEESGDKKCAKSINEELLARAMSIDLFYSERWKRGPAAPSEIQRQTPAPLGIQERQVAVVPSAPAGSTSNVESKPPQKVEMPAPPPIETKFDKGHKHKVSTKRLVDVESAIDEILRNLDPALAMFFDKGVKEYESQGSMPTPVSMVNAAIYLLVEFRKDVGDIQIDIFQSKDDNPYHGALIAVRMKAYNELSIGQNPSSEEYGRIGERAQSDVMPSIYRLQSLGKMIIAKK